MEANARRSRELSTGESELKRGVPVGEETLESSETRQDALLVVLVEVIGPGE